VAALRLAEKGYRVAVLECGRRLSDKDLAPSGWNLRRTFWVPRLGLRGPSRISIFKDIFIASGAGVGGGSLVYANTLYRAKPLFFTHRSGLTWRIGVPNCSRTTTRPSACWECAPCHGQ